MFLLPHSEDRVIQSSFVWIGYQRVTDRQTELPWLIQRFALQAMRPRCKTLSSTNACGSAEKNNIKLLSELSNIKGSYEKD